MEPTIGQRIMTKLAEEIERRLEENSKDLTAAELEFIRKFLGDNSVTLASVQRGEFGKTAQEALETFGPLPDVVEDIPLRVQ